MKKRKKMLKDNRDRFMADILKRTRELPQFPLVSADFRDLEKSVLAQYPDLLGPTRVQEVRLTAMAQTRIDEEGCCAVMAALRYPLYSEPTLRRAGVSARLDDGVYHDR